MRTLAFTLWQSQDLPSFDEIKEAVDRWRLQKSKCGETYHGQNCYRKPKHKGFCVSIVGYGAIGASWYTVEK